jgi:Sulfotransferase domain
MLYRRGEVGGNIENYLDPRTASENRFLVGGHYSRQLEEYLVHYSSNQIRVLFFEEMKENPVKQLIQLRKFLGVTEILPALPDDKKVKDKASPIVSPELRRSLSWLKPLVKPFRNTLIFGKLHAMVARKVEYPELSLELRKRLVEYYAPEADAPHSSTTGNAVKVLILSHIFLTGSVIMFSGKCKRYC